MPTTKKRSRKRTGRPRKKKETGNRKATTKRPVLRDTQFSRGRPTRATAFLLFKILLARREGLSIRFCGGPAGVTQVTLGDWLKKAEEHASSWHGRVLPRPTERAYIEMDFTFQRLAAAWEKAKRDSEELQTHVQPSYDGIEDFRAVAIGHWLSFLDQWEAITSVFVKDLASSIRRAPDWRAQAWLLERFAGDDYVKSERMVVAASVVESDGELNVSLRISPPLTVDPTAKGTE